MIVVLALISFWIESKSQIHYPDERWPLGTNEFPGTEGSGNAWVHFKADTVEIEEAELNMDFESTVAVANGTDGELLFYSNGCEVRGANGQQLENGQNLNPGMLHDWVCEIGYTVPRGMMALRMPENPDRWILLHLGGSYDAVRKLIYGPFYFSEIDMAANGGSGAIVSKNNILEEGELEPFAVVRHGNGRDWWVVIPEYGTSNYQIWLLSPQGISQFAQQSIGPAIGCRRVGSSVFSADGSKYARTNNCLAVSFDFDRCSGVFSNPVMLERPPHTIGGGGLAFSENNRWLYATSSLCIFRADLGSPVPFLDSLFKQPYFEGVSEYVFGTSLAYLQAAPDGKLYLNAQHRERFLSGLVLSNDTFQYEPAILELPVAAVRTLPHFPNFRLFDLPESPCDSLGIDGPTVNEEARPANLYGITAYPNPTDGKVAIDFRFPSVKELEISVFDVLGRCHRRTFCPANTPTFYLDLLECPSGIYQLRIDWGVGEMTWKTIVVQ